jgi:hydroxymethylpyrimidine pyrophosphatase-like HAD family hydrolase
MLKSLTRSVAMGNASESVKEAAAYVTRSNDEDGIVYALREYFQLI